MQQFRKFKAEHDVVARQIDEDNGGLVRNMSVDASLWERIWHQIADGPGEREEIREDDSLVSNFCGFEHIEIPSAKLDEDVTNLFIPRSEMFTAEFLVGRTAVCLSLIESNNLSENWTVEQVDSALTLSVAGFETLHKHARWSGVDVSWVYEIHRSVPTSMSAPLSAGTVPTPDYLLLRWDFAWMDDAMDYLGQGSGWSAQFRNANRVRREYTTDWGCNLYILRDEHGVGFEGNENPRGYSKSFSELSIGELARAPFAVVRFVPAGTRYLDAVVAHEVAHVFGAADEYSPSDGCKDGNSCDDLYGFLQHPNSNCVKCVDLPQNCMMVTSVPWGSFCTHTKKHLGWTDHDGDGQPQAIDNHGSLWATLHQVVPGDLVRIYTVSGGFVRGISVTANKMDTHPTGNTTLWDCLNYESQQVAPGAYYYVINDGEPRIFGTFAADPSWRPDGGLGPLVTYSFSTFACGDVTGDGVADPSDVMRFVNYLFYGDDPVEPLIAADVNCDGYTDLSDLVALVNYMMEGYPLMCCW
ncbi:MAG: dockerin type I domain-containing protein [candidate division Zixibacteria bacterium]|nr:dockerin type I domain-containing protein [candidate division Zixibacteria bacterium]